MSTYPENLAAIGAKRSGPVPKCLCGTCRTCRSREDARRRYNGRTYTDRASGRYQPSELCLPSDAVTIGYLAGLLDGEGCITLNNKCWRVQIAMTDECLIRWLGEIGGTVRERSVTGRRRPCWRWLLMRQAEVAEFLSAMLPHLRVKREQAAIALTEIKDRDDLRFAIRGLS